MNEQKSVTQELIDRLQQQVWSQSQLLKEKEETIQSLQKSLFGRSAHADVMEHKATKANALLCEKDARIEELEKERDELKVKLDKEYSDCLQVLAERDYRENQINEIANALGDSSEWSNITDRGDEALELVHQLKRDITLANQKLEKYDAIRDDILDYLDERLESNRYYPVHINEWAHTQLKALAKGDGSGS